MGMQHLRAGRNIKPDEIAAGQIAADAITASEIAADAVTTAKILDLNVTTGKLAADAVTGAKLADDAVDSEHYAAGSIDAEHIATGAVTPVKLEGLADTAATLRVVTPVVYRLKVAAADFGANDDIIIAVPAGHNLLIMDAIFHLTTVEGGVMTGQLFTAANGGGSAISGLFDLDASSGDLLRIGSIAAQAVAAGSNIYFHASSNPGTLAGWLYIYATHTT